MKTILKKPALISFFTSLLVCFALILVSDQPPYGYPDNELSNNYWGLITDIGHKWRNFNFSYWDKGLAGGVSLFTSGQYPILTPTNAFAWILNDNQFYIFKLLEPYLIGVFFTTLCFLDIFKVRYVSAIFAGMLYMGLFFSRHTIMAQSPFFLYGCALFPAMMYAYLKLHKRNLVLSFAIIGALSAYMFAAQGVTQTPQILFWWLIFIFIKCFFFSRGKLVRRTKAACLSAFVLIGMTVGMCAFQFIPTLFYSIFESTRSAGFYPINNFPIIEGSIFTKSLSQVAYDAFIQPGSVSIRGMSALLFISLAAYIIKERKGKKKNEFSRLLYITTTVFFLFPTVSHIIVNTFPFLYPVFKPMTVLTFRYAVHTIDFCLVYWCITTLGSIRYPLHSFKTTTIINKVLFFILNFIAGVILFLPSIILYVKSFHPLIDIHPQIQNFLPNQLFTNILTVVLTICCVLWFLRVIKHKQLNYAVSYGTIIFSVMLLVSCFFWNDKGRQNDLSSYYLETPELKYYKLAKGKFYMPVEAPKSMKYDYNLLYGVHGTSGFLPLSPKRYSSFLAAYSYNQSISKDMVGSYAKFDLENMQDSISTYFPVDFTSIRKGEDLNWPDFYKVVHGENYDIWQRRGESQRVFLSNELRVVSFKDQIRLWKKERSEYVTVSDRDAYDYSVKSNKLHNNIEDNPKMSFDKTKSDDLVKLNLDLKYDQYVTLNERFDPGWKVLINGERASIFPSYNIFLGFKAKKGMNRIKAVYRPPYLVLGLLINLISIIILLVLFLRKPIIRLRSSGMK